MVELPTRTLSEDQSTLLIGRAISERGSLDNLKISPGRALALFALELTSLVVSKDQGPALQGDRSAGGWSIDELVETLEPLCPLITTQSSCLLFAMLPTYPHCAES